MIDGYEVLDDFMEESGEAQLNAGYTAGNGIRVQILNRFEPEDMEYEMFLPDGWDNYWRVFDFTPDQAEKLGNALIRWAKARR